MQTVQKSSTPCNKVAAAASACAFSTEHYVFSQCTRFPDAEKLWVQQLVRETLSSARVTRAAYGSLLQACGETKSLAYGRLVHEHLSGTGVNAGSIFLGNHLVQMYGRCGSVDEATAVFEGMERRNVVSWSFVIVANARSGYHGRAMQFFRRMLQDGSELDRVLIVVVLGSCFGLRTGRSIHDLVVECGFGAETVVCTALLGMYCRCRSLGDAESVFWSLEEKDVVSWNAMITAIVDGGYGSRDVIGVFRRMLVEGMKPNRVTFISTLRSVQSERDCLWLHGIIRESGLEHDEFVVNSLVSLYGKQGSIENARRAFSAVSNASIGSWNTMISAYAQCGHFKEALETFMIVMKQSIKPDQISFVNVLEAITAPECTKDGEFIHDCVIEYGFENDAIVGGALLGMYSRCGNLEKAEEVFENIHPHRTVILWNSMLAAYTQSGQCKKTIKLFMEMQQDGTKASEATFALLLTACANISILPQGKIVHSCIKQWFHFCTADVNAYSYIIIQNGLINMYAKCGSLDLALLTFNSMQQRDVASWNSVLAAFARHGSGHRALTFLKRMHLEGIRPDHITYTTVLTACSHHGLFKEGRKCYDFMTKVHGLQPGVAHYGCMVDLLGRGGWLEEAENLITTMPIPAESTVWTALLSASRMHGDLERANLALKHLTRTAS